MSEALGYKTICPKCGAEMWSSQRCCMKCGTLNYEHPLNQQMKPYLDKNVVSPQTFVIGEKSLDGLSFAHPSRAGNRTVCILVHLLFYFFYLILSVYFIQVSEHYSLVQSLLYPKFSVFLFFGTLCFFFSLSVQFMYMKAGFPWWSYYIPFYNLYVFFQITLKKGWLFLLTFIPIVGIVFLFYSFYRMGVVFGKNGWFSCLFPIFAIPMIAFQPDVFYEKKENIFAASTNDDYLEKIYHSNHRLLFFYGFFFIISIAIFCSQYISSIYKFFLQWFSFYQ